MDNSFFDRLLTEAQELATKRNCYLKVTQNCTLIQKRKNVTYQMKSITSSLSHHEFVSLIVCLGMMFTLVVKLNCI